MEQSTSILDAIKEQTTNIEHLATSGQVQSVLAETLQEFATKERITRESTITVASSQNLSLDQVAGLIDKHWIKAKEQAPTTYWKDKEHVYVQFLNQQVKEVFLEYAAAKEELKRLSESIAKPDHNGHHLKRKEVRIVINGIPEHIEADKVEQTILSLAGPKATISSVRAGKPYGSGAKKMKSLMLGVNAEGYRLIYKVIGGSIPYNDEKTRLRLFPKIACKPWSCRDCFFIGPNHVCTGRACGQCGKVGHASRDCLSKTRYCSNCKRPGHRAKDAHCPIFLREVSKEIKRMDIPLEVLENKNKRFELIRNLAYK